MGAHYSSITVVCCLIEIQEIEGEFQQQLWWTGLHVCTLTHTHSNKHLANQVTPIITTLISGRTWYI